MKLDGAKDFCRDYDAQLLKIPNKEEQSKLINAFIIAGHEEEFGLEKNENYSIGLTRSLAQGGKYWDLY